MHWHIVGTGRIGCLAAFYLQQAGMHVTGVRPGPAYDREVVLSFDRGARQVFTLPMQPPETTGRVSCLLVACKAPYTAQCLSRVCLTPDATVVRLQNGLGTLDNLLSRGQHLIEGVTKSAVMSDARGALRVVAENATTFGGGTQPAWFDHALMHWPKLQWQEDMRFTQWGKLVVNAAINPLTAIHDVPNGALLERTDMRAEWLALVSEADQLLAYLDPDWPADSQDDVAAVIETTAKNTSSMRADVQNGNRTEIEAINGWLLRQAANRGLDLPAHRRVVAQIHALEPG